MHDENEMTYYGALQLMSNRYEVLLLDPGSKKLSFKNPVPVTRTGLRFRLSKRPHNVAVLLGTEPLPGLRLFVLDADTDQARAYMEEHDLTSPQRVLTSRGTHDYGLTPLEGVTNKINCLRIGLDILFHGHAVCPPSTNAKAGGFRYTFQNGIVRADRLPVLEIPEELLKEPVKEVKTEIRQRTDIVVASLDDAKKIESARGALSRRRSIAGQGGDKELFKAAALLVQWYRLPREVCLALLRDWNQTNCEPPWPDARLVYKVDQAIKLMK